MLQTFLIDQTVCFVGPTLALEYANLAIKSPKSNEIWDEILSTYALHCKKGRALFEAWRVHYQETEPEYVKFTLN